MANKPVLSALVLAAALAWSGALAAQPADLVKNGDFQSVGPDGVPAGWRTAGHKGIEQVITSDAGPEGKKSLKLHCTAFIPGFPDSHAMAALMNVVGVEKGRSCRVTWWAKGAALPGDSSPALAATMELTRTGPWKRVFAESFRVFASWRKYEGVYEAPDDLPSDKSRLAFYMKTTGTLWLSDVSIVPVEPKPARVEWWPEIRAPKDSPNLLPNSDFECDAANWGGFSPYLQGSGGNRTNLQTLVGDIDDAVAWQGKKSLRIHLDKAKLEILRCVTSNGVTKEPVRAVSVANVGWIPVKAGETYVFSCYVKSDKPGVSARLTVTVPAQEMTTYLAAKSFDVTTEWRRLVVPVTPKEDTFVWVSAGLDIQNSRPDDATVWIDAMQFEQGDQATPYTPRAKVESFLLTSQPGNIFTAPAAGMSLRLVARNAGNADILVKGRLAATDFLDREVWSKDVQFPVAAGASASLPLDGVLKGRKGFFRFTWKPEDHGEPFLQSLRAAVIDEYVGTDSPFGMNSTWGWPLLCNLARKGGVLWMRDWSSTWENIEHEPGKFDFTAPDSLIDFILSNRQDPLVLLPYPSAKWSSSADMKVIDEEVKRTGSEWARTRLICACPPKDLAPFRNYVTKTVEHDLARTKCFEIFNEPLYTEYSFPSRFGFKMRDFVEVQKAAFEAVKAASKEAQVIGGTSSHPGKDLTREFILAGGLDWVDVMNIHWYPQVTEGAEMGERDLAEVRKMMVERNRAVPIWVTEMGCYAEDDLPVTPASLYVIGDDTMARCRYPSERDAAAGMVKYCALMFRYGATKVFFHAGASGTINAGALRGHSEGASVFFKYGGVPRKMYPALSAMAELFGTDFVPIGSDNRGPCFACWFRVKQGGLAVAWKNDYIEGAVEGKPVELKLPAGVSAFDLMGNPLDGPAIEVTDVPVYLRSADENVWKVLFPPHPPRPAE